MSVVVRRTLYGKMAGDTTLTALLGSAAAGYSKAIYFQSAPAAAAFPYIIFSKQSSTPSYSFGGRNFDHDVWLIKGVAREGATGTDAANQADDIASRLDALLTDGTVNISGRDDRYLRRESDVEFSEIADGVLYRHSGSYYRLIYE
jgi:hypothetical protein